MTRTADFDVVIVGAGMVGAALACALGESGLRIALLEAREPQAFVSGEEVDLRVSALSRASERILSALGAWESIKTMRVSPYREMRVWDAGSAGRVHFDAASIGEPSLGHIVENRLIQHALLERACRLSNLEWFCPAISVAVSFGDEYARVRLEDGRELHAALLVAADGADSRLRDMAGITTTGEPYDQHGVVTTIRTARHHGETAWQRFLPDGPLALLPLADGRCSIVWSTTPEHAEQLLQLPEAEFCATLTEVSEAVLGDVRACGPRARFPLRKLHADAYVRPRFALVGDAAHAVHPLAGQGVNLGFLDAAVLSEVLQQEIGRAHV